MNELKPCPFCGSDVATFNSIANSKFYRCDDCGAFVNFRFATGDEEADEAWNRRVEDEQ